MKNSKGEIDSESMAALENLLLQFPGGLNAISDLSERRTALNSITKKLTDLEYSDVEVIDFTVPSGDEHQSIPLRLYRSKSKSEMTPAPCLIYVHGGGMIMGNLETGNLNCLNFVRKFKLTVISIEYRKAPEFPYPSAIQDCLDAITWVINSSDSLGIDLSNLGIYGSSAGGGLVLGTVLKLRDQGRDVFKYMMPIYPMIDDSNTSLSSQEIIDIGVWDRKANVEAWGWYLSGKGADGYAAPIRSKNLTNLPQCYSDVGEFDLFRDENSSFFTRLENSGVSTEFKIFPGAFHGSENLAPESGLSKEIWKSRFEAIERFIQD